MFPVGHSKSESYFGQLASVLFVCYDGIPQAAFIVCLWLTDEHTNFPKHTTTDLSPFPLLRYEKNVDGNIHRQMFRVESILGPAICLPQTLQAVDLSSPPNVLARLPMYLVPSEFLTRQLTTQPSSVLCRRTEQLCRSKNRLLPFIFPKDQLNEEYIRRILPRFVFGVQDEPDNAAS